MSPQDTQMLNDFLNQLVQANGIQKDPEADALIQRAVSRQPDASYLLVQRALLMEQALNNAKGQIAALQDQVSQLRSGQPGGQGDGRFLDANTWGNSGGSRPGNAPMHYQGGNQNQQPYQPKYQPPPQPQYQPQYQPQGGSMMGSMFGGPGGFLRGGGGGGLLGSIAATAAGVAAGSFLFHGLDNMFHHHDQGGSRLLNSDDTGNNLFSDQSGSSLADQAGLGDVGQSFDNGSSQDQGLLDNGALEGASLDSSSEGLFDSGVDDGGGSLDSTGGFFDGDGSDEGLFS